MGCLWCTAALATREAHTRSGACACMHGPRPGPSVRGRSQVLFFHHDLRACAVRASRRPTITTATYLTTRRPFLLALSGICPGEPALPNEPVTKARTRFRSQPWHTRSQLDAVRVTSQVTVKPSFDATMSEPASIIRSTAAVLLAASVRRWERVCVFRKVTSQPEVAK